MLLRVLSGGPVFLLIALISLSALGGGASRPVAGSATAVLYSVSSADDSLRVVDPVTASTQSEVTITLAGKSVEAATGLATHPTTGELWAILKIAGQTGRELVRINPDTGVATNVGDTGDSFAGIAFDATGTLYGVTGDGAAVPETLYMLNTNNASPALIGTLGAGNDGEAIAFNPDDGLLYHMSGSTTGNPPVVLVFESINPGNLAMTTIPTSGAAYREALGLTYSEAAGTFIMSDLNTKLFQITSGGVVTLVGTLDHKAKGLAFAMPVSGETPTPTQTPSPTPTSSSTPTATPSNTPGPSRIAGDVDCNGSVNSVDALKILRSVAMLSVEQHQPCPKIGDPALAFAPTVGEPQLQGDVDCDGTVNAVDALKVLRSVAGLPNNLPGGCPQIGDPIPSLR